MYGKVFASMWDGSIYGRFEASATLMVLLTLCDSQGVVDMTPEAIAGRTGWPLEFIRQGLHDLSEPDTRSRSGDADGRRIMLVDPSRPWGWSIVNHAYYRGLASAEEKREADRLRIASKRAMSQPVATRRKGSRMSPMQDADAYADTEAKTESTKPPSKGLNGKHGPASLPSQPRARPSRLPDNFALTPELRAYAVAEGVDADRELGRFCDYWRAKAGAGAVKADWPATWRNWCRSAHDRGGSQPGQRARPKTLAELEAIENARK